MAEEHFLSLTTSQVATLINAKWEDPQNLPAVPVLPIDNLDIRDLWRLKVPLAISLTQFVPRPIRPRMHRGDDIPPVFLTAPGDRRTRATAWWDLTDPRIEQVGWIDGLFTTDQFIASRGFRDPNQWSLTGMISPELLMFLGKAVGPPHGSDRVWGEFYCFGMEPHKIHTLRRDAVIGTAWR